MRRPWRNVSEHTRGLGVSFRLLPPDGARTYERLRMESAACGADGGERLVGDTVWPVPWDSERMSRFEGRVGRMVPSASGARVVGAGEDRPICTCATSVVAERCDIMRRSLPLLS
jgi:hypothetical protein